MRSKFSNAEVVAEFKRRRVRLLALFVPGFVALFVMLGVKVDIGVYFITFIVWFFVAGWYMSFRFRCPRCNAIPWNPSGPGVTLIPHHCTQCKAPLSDVALHEADLHD